MKLQAGTVSAWQGGTARYIIIATTRTRAPGFLLDKENYIVGVSRARTATIVLGRKPVLCKGGMENDTWRHFLTVAEKRHISSNPLVNRYTGIALRAFNHGRERQA